METTVIIDAGHIKPCGHFAARFELRGDPDMVDSDYVTWDFGPVLRLEPGMTDVQIERVIRLVQEFIDLAKSQGRGELAAELRELLGAERSG